MAPIPVVIVGCGSIGALHVRTLARHPAFHVVALVDAVDGAADRLADLSEREHSGTRALTFSSLADALAESDAEVVVICTPSGFHAQIAEEALAAGRHIVIEKPLDVELARGRRIADLARAAARRGIHSSVISQHRFDPGSVVIARAIAEGRFGTITSGFAVSPWWRGQDYYDSSEWRGTWALDGGGALMNQGVHTLDLLIALLGRPVEIYAQTALLAHHGIEVEDVAVATLRFESGALAILNATTAGYPGLGTRLQVQGSRGSAVLADDELAFFHVLEAGASGAASGSPADQSAQELARLAADPDIDDRTLLGHYRQYDDMARAIESRTPPTMTVEAGFTTLATVIAVYLSATLGHPVDVADVVAGHYDGVELRVGRSAAS